MRAELAAFRCHSFAASHVAADDEDIEKRLELAHSKQSTALPFVMEVTLFRGETFVSDQEVPRSNLSRRFWS